VGATTTSKKGAFKYGDPLGCLVLDRAAERVEARTSLLVLRLCARLARRRRTNPTAPAPGDGVTQKRREGRARRRVERRRAHSLEPAKQHPDVALHSAAGTRHARAARHVRRNHRSRRFGHAERSGRGGVPHPVWRHRVRLVPSAHPHSRAPRAATIHAVRHWACVLASRALFFLQRSSTRA